MAPKEARTGVQTRVDSARSLYQQQSAEVQVAFKTLNSQEFEKPYIIKKNKKKVMSTDTLDDVSPKDNEKILYSHYDQEPKYCHNQTAIDRQNRNILGTSTKQTIITVDGVNVKKKKRVIEFDPTDRNLVKKV